MAKKKPSGCIFCVIARGEDQKTTLLYKDEELIVFKDRKPAAPHHYLVCPVTHIRDAKRLTRRHIEMVQRMVEIGKQVLQEKEGNISEASLGFHWPPTCSVYHLHLHVIAPTSQIKRIYKVMGAYSPDGWMFKTADWLIDRLKQMPEENPDESRVVPGS